jgi:hypothetical protein
VCNKFTAKRHVILKMRNIIIYWAALRYALLTGSPDQVRGLRPPLRINPRQNKGFVLVIVLIFVLIINLVLAHYLARNEQFIKTNAHQTRALQMREAP